MKIIAETKDGYIVDLEESELQQLTGFYYNSHKFRIGEQLKIDSLFYQLVKLTQQEDKIKKISHSLKTAAGMLEKIDPIFYEEKKA